MINKLLTLIRQKKIKFINSYVFLVTNYIVLGSEKTEAIYIKHHIYIFFENKKQTDKMTEHGMK